MKLVKMNKCCNVLVCSNNSNTDPLPPPDSIGVQNIGPHSITFSWNKASCDTVDYNITSRGCGNCPTTANTTSVMCSDLIVNDTPTECHFAVQTVLCGNTTGNDIAVAILVLKGI